MGLFWNLIQQSQIEEQKNSSQSLEQRVGYLENEL
jgi:polyhydroxyalkanoate synthesis regulator phasin